MINTQQDVATEIRIAQIRQNVTGRALAQQIGWDQSTLSRKLHCGSELTLPELDLIAAALGLTVQITLVPTSMSDAPTGDDEVLVAA